MFDYKGIFEPFGQVRGWLLSPSNHGIIPGSVPTHKGHWETYTRDLWPFLI